MASQRGLCVSVLPSVSQRKVHGKALSYVYVAGFDRNVGRAAGAGRRCWPQVRLVPPVKCQLMLDGSYPADA